MGEVSKDLLRERIKNKRASEGLEDIPQEELFAKKRKHDMSDDERKKLQERRSRNKEAAEKSRKKKKHEFEKLQSENDQLNQDKCELAAMIEQLKKQNGTYRFQLDHLKRWIAKRADVLGLQKKENTLPPESSHKSDVLRGDPSLHYTENASGFAEDLIAAAERSHSPPTSSPASSATPSKAGSPPPIPMSVDDFQPVGIKTMAPQQHSEMVAPWRVQQPPVSTTQASIPVEAEKKKEEETKIVRNVTSPPRPAPVAKVVMDPMPARSIQLVSEEQQQVVYMPNPLNTVYVMQGEGGQQMLMQAPQTAPMQIVYGPPPVTAFPQIAVSTPSQVFLATEVPKTSEVDSINRSTMSVISGGNVADGMIDVAANADKSQKMTVAKDENTADTGIDKEKSTICDPSVVTAIESLLKLGYKIERPGDGKKSAPCATTALQVTEEGSMSMAEDQNFLQAPLVINVPMDDPQSFPTITVH